MIKLSKTLLLSLLLSSISVFPVFADEVGVTPTSIKFGQPAAIDGPAAALGKGMQLGLLAAFAEANANGGINGHKIELITRDDGYDPAKSVVALNQLIDEDKVFGIVGAVGTPTSNAMLPIAAEKNIPYIGAMTGAKSLRDPKWKNVVNLRASYGQETEAWIEHLTKDLGVKKIAAFYQDDAFGQAGLSGVKDALQKRNMQLIAEGSYPRNTKDIQAALQTIKEAKPEAVVMVATYGAAAEFICEAKKLNLGAVFVNISFVGSDALAKDLGEQADGVVVTQVVPSYYDITVPLVLRYFKALRAMGAHESPSFLSLEGYADGRLVVDALGRTKGDITRKSFMEALASGTYDLGGLTLTFGNGRTQGSDDVFLTVIGKDGSFQPVKTLTK